MSHIALIPAAGIGSRFGAPQPKQYAQLLGKAVLQHTIDCFARNTRIAHIIIVISPSDEWFNDCITPPHHATVLRLGGETRAHSIANGLQYALQHQLIAPNDTLLVHDAARCCLPQTALNRLLDALDNDTQQHGAILAIPVADTLKQQTSQQRIAQTISRDNLWQAQTPQAFQAALLHRALSQCTLTNITDDASAVEQLGIQPMLIEGDSRNIKLTRPDDALLASYFLQNEIQSAAVHQKAD